MLCVYSESVARNDAFDLHNGAQTNCNTSHALQSKVHHHAIPTYHGDMAWHVIAWSVKLAVNRSDVHIQWKIWFVSIDDSQRCHVRVIDGEIMMT